MEKVEIIRKNVHEDEGSDWSGEVWLVKQGETYYALSSVIGPRGQECLAFRAHEDGTANPPEGRMGVGPDYGGGFGMSHEDVIRMLEEYGPREDFFWSEDGSGGGILGILEDLCKFAEGFVPLCPGGNDGDG